MNAHTEKNDEVAVSGITDEELIKILQLVQLSSDLREGVGKTGEELEMALHSKLSFPVVGSIENYLEDEGAEIRDQLTAFVTSHLDPADLAIWHTRGSGGRSDLVMKAKTAINTDPKTKRIVDLLLTAATSIRKCIEFYNLNSAYGDLDDFGNLLLDAAGDINRVRVIHDVIPLLERGLHAKEVRETLDFWEKNRDDPSVNKIEGNWQKELTARTGVLRRALGGKVVLLNSQAHVGSEGLDGKGDRITDFLLQNSETRNIFLVEIKTPETPLLGGLYRNTYGFSEELSGTVSQVLVQRHEAMTNFFMKHHKSGVDFNVAAPRCIVIAGRLDKEIRDDKVKQAAFEMQRQAIEANVRVITFDELYSDFSSFHLIDD